MPEEHRSECPAIDPRKLNALRIATQKRKDRNMKLSDLPNVLRIMADRIEESGLQDRKVRFSIDSYDKIETREELAKWAAFMHESGSPPKVTRSGESVWLNAFGNISFTMFFKAGLLGGKVIEVIEDDDAGLAQLLSEVEQPVEDLLGTTVRIAD